MGNIKKKTQLIFFFILVFLKLYNIIYLFFSAFLSKIILLYYNIQYSIFIYFLKILENIKIIEKYT